MFVPSTALSTTCRNSGLSGSSWGCGPSGPTHTCSGCRCTTFGVGVQLPDGREAVWDADNSDVLSATVMRDGVLVGYVPIVADSAGLDDQATVQVIARTDYDAPHGQRRERALPLGPAKPMRRGLLARALEGFR